ncbi:bacillithiol biosynthesis cysteine-adding enzyme BshC [Salipaludibacillus sp. CF4.18]|uniref:bacillithiol biosynthesis cysteine-adding enzyme BshC n=1 Tax=Salipaludibacillus sp. CF4.18 TaxID=3373081 RepID=UPI003EE540BA
MEMKITNTHESGSFIHKYLNNNRNALSFFDYNLSSKSQRSRYDELMRMSFQREELVQALTSYNKKYNAYPRTFAQIERLKQKESVVVVGGQQAGLLTGPIYTVNKILSILIEARDLEESLSSPVIPIFWIAGEDHDIDEVNHTFFTDGKETKKIKITERNDLKQPVSERIIDQEEAKKLVKVAFQFLPETEHTACLYKKLLEDIEQGNTYSEWCAKLLSRLFADTGLVLMDAADPQIRQIEQPYFQEMIRKNDSIRASFLEQAREMKAADFGEPITIDQQNAHLFFHEEKQRFLLERLEDGDYQEKEGSRKWSEDEMLEAVTTGKLALSNNVVTRPLMQDLLLPVHTFIAGPGELKYWGTLKQVFHSFDRCMPLVKPRYHITYLSRRSEKTIRKYQLDTKKITFEGTQQEREQIINDGKAVDDVKVFKKAKKRLAKFEDKLEEGISPLGKGALLLHDQFRLKMKEQLKVYEKEISHFVESTQRIHLQRLLCLEVEVRPNGNWQERHLNIFPFLNLYGEDLVKDTFNEMLDHRKLLETGHHLYLTM